MSTDTIPAKHRFWIITLSLLLPVVVTVLYYIPKPTGISPEWTGYLALLPLFNASVNGTTALVLVAAFLAIKNKNVDLHRKLMFTALVLSGFFLLSYVIYHFTMPSTPYPKEAAYRGIYFFILLTHIALSAIIVPLVLISLSRGLSSQFAKHRAIAKITMPLWLYVAVTGVLVYLLISPHYSH
jgi:putative membrane protein